VRSTDTPDTSAMQPAPAPSRTSSGSLASGRLRRVASWLGLCALTACNSPQPPAPRGAGGAPPPASRAPVPPPNSQPVAPFTRPARSADEYHRQIAARLIAANPTITYTTPAPNPLLAIPVLEIEVNGDGSVRHIKVIRTPTQAADTVQIAIDAVRRAAPFGDATHLARPWKFTEVFLFDDDRRFKPRILD
jgi:hypothetical protein